MTWTHRICGECWIERQIAEHGAHHPYRPPILTQTSASEACCFCGGPTRLGIWLRHDPAALKCSHPPDEDE